MTVCPYPIAVMSFNRPDYLTQVLQSLKNQTVSINEDRLYLFQDGAKSRFSEAVVNETLHIECVKRFQEVFPGGRVLQSPVNLGIALNFDRAERLFFDELKAECGLFFEDDLVLSPYYLDALLQLANFALQEPLVSYVAAYGDRTAPLEKQRALATQITRLEHNWGFALTRRQWLRQREIVDGYLDIIRGGEYALRDVGKIQAYFASLGYLHPASSQDGAKTAAGYILGTVRLMCMPCFGRYIGEHGTHYNSHFFNLEGHAKTELYNEPPQIFDFPNLARLNDWLAQDRAAGLRLLEKYRSSGDVTDITVETSAIEFIQNLYRLLLKRSPDKEGLRLWVKFLRDGGTPSRLVEVFVNSKEYRTRVENNKV